MGLHYADQFKRLKVMQDADAIVADCHDLIAAHGLDPVVAREVVAKAMLAEQPLPLAGQLDGNTNAGLTRAPQRLSDALSRLSD